MQLSAKRLKSVFIPSPEQEDRRELTRLRSTYVKERNRTAARLKHKANYHGLIGPDDSRTVCEKWLTIVLEKPMGKYTRYVFEELTEEWRRFDRKVKEISKRIEEQTSEDIEAEKVYRSDKGIGPTAARILANELGDMMLFSSEKSLFCYTSFTPCEYSSGDHVRKGHISRQGKGILRSILVQCCWGQSNMIQALWKYLRDCREEQVKSERL